MAEISPMNINQNYEIGYQALPPWAQDERETNAIQEDPQLKEYLDRVYGNVLAIDKQYDKTSKYYNVMIQTNDGQLLTVRVNVTYHPQTDGRCGPAVFSLDFEFPQVQ